MLHVFKASSLNARLANRWMRWAFYVGALPIALFVLLAVYWPKPEPMLTRIATAERWIEPLGSFEFNQPALEPLVRTLPSFAGANWQAVNLPDSIKLENVVPLQPHGPKSRVWFRLHIPADVLQPSATADGQLALLGNRVMGGPWAVWVNGRLVQANLADWRIQWNVPLRVALPDLVTESGPAEVLLSVPYMDAKGYAMGSLFIGPAAQVDMAWKKRNYWQSDVSSICTALAVAIMLITFQLALGRTRVVLFQLLCANAVFWVVSGYQFTHDFVGHERLSIWFGWAVDASINWIIVLTALVSLELADIAMPRFRLAVVAYGVLSSFFTMPFWEWGVNGLMVQHQINVLINITLNSVLVWYAYAHTTRERVLISLGNVLYSFVGLHDLFYLTNQTAPDHIYTFQMGAIILFVVFMYVTNRRYLQAEEASEQYRHALEQKSQEQVRLLHEQEERLNLQAATLLQQSEELRELELQKRLDAQHTAFTLDLHDRVGSNITTGIHQVRNSKLTGEEIVLMLQDISDEVRSFSHMKATTPFTLGEILAKVRDRVEPRLAHGSIELQWAVPIRLPSTPLDGTTASHVNAILNETIANTIKHANASVIRLSVQVQPGSIEISITDNGTGFDPTTVKKGRGLVGMHSRAQQIGGVLHFTSTPGQGSVMTLQWVLA